VRALSTVAEKTACRGVLRQRFRRTGLEPTLQHRPNPTNPSYPPASEGARPGTLADAVGTNSVMGEGCLRCCPDDQRQIGDSEHKARIPRCDEIPQVSDSCGRLLRVDANGENKAAVLFRGQRSRVVCVRGTLGSLERPERTVGQVLFDPDNDSKRRDLSRPRPNASHS